MAATSSLQLRATSNFGTPSATATTICELKTIIEKEIGISGLLQIAATSGLRLPLNVGVEAGQLILIVAVLDALRCAKLIKFPVFVERHARSVATYAIGIMAAYWFIERLAGFAT